MKNKPLLFKIITIISVFTVIFSVLSISSFAYTYDNTSAYNNNVEQFTLPETQIILQRTGIVLDDDIPGYIYLPASDYYARGEKIITSFNTSNDRRFVFKKNVTSSNVYENNGYVQQSTIQYNTVVNIYDLYGILIEEWWINGNAIDSIYNSMTFTLNNPTLLQQYVVENNVIYWERYIFTLPIRYYFDYVDLDGSQRTLELLGRIIPTHVSGNQWEVNVKYLPASLYTPHFSEYGSSIELNSTYSIDLSNIAYIKSLAIFVGEDGFGGGFFRTDLGDGGSVLDSRSGSYTNRLNIPNYAGDTFDTVLDNVGDTYYDNGYDTGYDIGYDGGYSAGTAEGYYDGYDAGNTAGYNTGYDAGYIAGIAEGGSGTLNPFDSVISAVGSFLDWEFIDGISMAGILSIVLGVCLVITFLKFFAGG